MIFDGQTVTIGSQWGEGPFAEGEALSYLNEVEEKFNVQIEFVQEGDPEDFASGIMAGEPAADVYILRNRHFETLAADGMVYPLDDVLDKEYWQRLPETHRDNQEAYKFVDRFYAFPSGGVLGYDRDFVEFANIYWNKEIFCQKRFAEFI